MPLKIVGEYTRSLPSRNGSTGPPRVLSKWGAVGDVLHRRADVKFLEGYSVDLDGHSIYAVSYFVVDGDAEDTWVVAGAESEVLIAMCTGARVWQQHVAQGETDRPLVFVALTDGATLVIGGVPSCLFSWTSGIGCRVPRQPLVHVGGAPVRGAG